MSHHPYRRAFNLLACISMLSEWLPNLHLRVTYPALPSRAGHSLGVQNCQAFWRYMKKVKWEKGPWEVLAGLLGDPAALGVGQGGCAEPRLNGCTITLLLRVRPLTSKEYHRSSKQDPKHQSSRTYLNIPSFFQPSFDEACHDNCIPIHNIHVWFYNELFPYQGSCGKREV